MKSQVKNKVDRTWRENAAVWGLGHFYREMVLPQGGGDSVLPCAPQDRQEAH